MSQQDPQQSDDFFDQPVLRELCEVAESAGWRVAFAYDPADLRQLSGGLAAGAAISTRRVILLHPGLWDSVIWAIFVLVHKLAECLMDDLREAPDDVPARPAADANTVRCLVCARMGIRVFDFGAVLNPPYPSPVVDCTKRILDALLPYAGGRST